MMEEASKGLLVRAGSIDITPQVAAPLVGFAGRNSPFQGVRDQLELNAVVATVRGKCVAFVTIDTLFASNELAGIIESELRRTFDVASADVVVAASHTHFAPAIDPYP